MKLYEVKSDSLQAASTFLAESPNFQCVDHLTISPRQAGSAEAFQQTCRVTKLLPTESNGVRGRSVLKTTQAAWSREARRRLAAAGIDTLEGSV